jgi:hypothetical protein
MKEVAMLTALRTMFQKIFRIGKAVEAVSTTVTDASTIARQKGLKDVAGAIVQTANDASTATSSIQDAAK